MPNTKTAAKEMRKNARRRRLNLTYINRYRRALRLLKDARTKQEVEKLLPALYSILDKMAKRNILHTNKAARLKMRVARIAREKLSGAVS